MTPTLKPDPVSSPTTGRPVTANNPASIAQALRRIALFKDLSLSEIDSIAAKFHVTHVPKESVVFYEQDHPNEVGPRVYFVIDGCIKLVKYSTDGESTIVRLSSAGEFFGVTSALTNRPHPFSAEALTDSTVATLHRDEFHSIAMHYPQIALDMLCALGEVLWFNYATHNQVVKKSEARVAKIILYHLHRDGYEKTSEGMQLNIQLPHDYLASMTGIAYEESVRIISRLKKQHQCIKYLRGGRIIVTDCDALKIVGQEKDHAGL